MVAPKKTGPLNVTELIALWRSVVDPLYGSRLVELGEGRGFEIFTQGMEQLVRVSQAIDRTTQAMYILPFSGQTSEPARRSAKAQVTLELTRVRGFELDLPIFAGQVVFAEETTDMGVDGPVTVLTGRQYVVKETTTFRAGDPGPIQLACEAVRTGYGYNNAQPGNIRRFVQPGIFNNSGASVVPGTQTHRLVARSEPDVPVPEHVGRYVQMVAGANVGQVRRVVGYAEPVVTGQAPNGGTLLLAPMGVYQATGIGDFIVGEEVLQLSTSARGKLISVDLANNKVIIDRTAGSFTLTPIVGVVSSATAVLSAEEVSQDMTAEDGTASWRILDWETDLGISATNPAMPEGGRADMLAELGAERAVYPSAGEDEESFRHRVATPADVVTPNAVRRAGNRVLGPYGLTVRMREVGSASFPGLFHDVPPSDDPANNYAHDMDFAVRPQDRFKVIFSYEEMRAFFLICVPPLNLGEFGIAHDDGTHNAHDAAPFLAFHDGYPVTASILLRNLWQAINAVKAGGVGFDIVQDAEDA